MSMIDLSQPSLWISLASITLNPTFWNIAAQKEYRTHWLTKLMGNDRYRGCYAIAVTIFSLGLIRDYLYKEALLAQPSHALLDTAAVKLVAALLFGAGMTFVATSTYALGLTGTYLGDYFGILMDARVTGFPFNVLENPMYVGSAMSFLGTALWYAKPAGVAITLYVWAVYTVALRFEGPFTTMIYANRDKVANAADRTSRKKKL